MVSLIEKCTRFHIHCAHHLCEEPMSSFDAKINNENMTKCLQSLKEMYQDLANKGIYCKSEAEFRGYNVLLNLNKGDILRWEWRILLGFCLAFREKLELSPDKLQRKWWTYFNLQCQSKAVVYCYNVILIFGRSLEGKKKDNYAILTALSPIGSRKIHFVDNVKPWFSVHLPSCLLS